MKKREEVVRKLRGERPKRIPWKPIAGVVVTIAAFAIVLLALKAGLGWPTSLLTLGVMLAIAWFVGVVAGERLAPRWSALVGLALAGGLVVSTLGFGIPWKIAEVEEGEVAYENFLYQASFKYRGSEDNLPIENVAIRFPCPNVENVAMGVRQGTWMLYWQDEENVLHEQIWGTDNGEILDFYAYYGERNENLEILLTGIEPTSYGPMIYYRMDKLYPREVFWVTSLVEVPKKNADEVTLRVYEDNQGRSLAQYWYPSNVHLENQGDPVNISFWVQLSRKIENDYQIIETFSRSVENASMLGQWLYPP